MNRRRFLPALGAFLAGCGDSIRRATEPPPEMPPPCPTCGPKERPVVEVPDAPPPPDPPELPALFVEHLATLSQRASDPAECARIVAEHGIQGYRTLTVLARWGPGGQAAQPPPGWFVSPLERPDEYFDRFRAWDDACRQHGLIAMPCAFDDPLRWNPASEPWVAEALRQEVIDPASASTWLDAFDTSWDEAESLLEFYFGWMEPSPHRLLEGVNEHGDWPGGYTRPPVDRIAQWIRDRGHRVARGTRIGDDGPYPRAHVIAEHSWGPPGALQPWPPWGRLEAIQRANPGAHLMLSTDGFGLVGNEDAGAVAGEVIARGYSFAGLVRISPDRWDAATRRALDAMVASVDRSRRAA